VLSMIVDKNLVYANARMAHLTNIQQTKDTVAYYKEKYLAYVDTQYAFAGSPEDPELDVNEAHWSWKTEQADLDELLRRHFSAKQTIDNLLADIQVRMSNPGMDNGALDRIASRICKFMEQSGLHWIPIEKMGHMRMFRFLHYTWGTYTNPLNLEEAWVIIPLIGMDFMKQYDGGLDFLSIGTKMKEKPYQRVFRNQNPPLSVLGQDI
jgi:hypothetical protein